jgi:CRISPR-associated protein Csx17
MYLHVLKGCAPAPLANYLKALGILRLVGEQADPQARGWWDGERFCLLSKLSEQDLETFFLEKYEPTPIFNPWGGRSGYYAGLSKKKQDPEKMAGIALKAVEQSTTSRLARFREAITIIRSVINEGSGLKPEDEEASTAMVLGIRKRIRGAGLNWLDTVLADLGGSFHGPAILGTGGNEGSGSYTAAFLAAVVECVLRGDWNEDLPPSLWSDGADRDSWDGGFQPPPTESVKKPEKETVAGPFRQYLPSGQGSPWDLLLAFEGAIVVQSGVARRSNGDKHRFLTSPYYFASLGMGAGSSSEMDEFVLNKGRKNPGRGEQWFPLWGTPSTFAEIQLLFREGRCSCGRRAAKNPLDAARAICGLGTARGITTFLRYGYLQRDNLATHFAVPLGRIQVREKSTARLVDDLTDWLDKLHQTARDKNAPARLVHAERRLADAVFAALTHDYTPERWQAILLAAAEIESLQASGTGIDAGPIPALRPDWVSAVADQSAEFRLALALGSAAASYFEKKPSDPIRHHLLPLEPGARRFQTAEKRLVNDPRVVVSGRDPLRDLAAIVERRLIEAAQRGQRRSRLVAAAGCGARLDDLAQFLSGAIDLDRLFGLARAFMTIKWDQWSREHLPRSRESNEMPDECWLAVRLCCLPFAIDDVHDIPADERIVRLLIAGDAARAIEIARQRLRSVGIRPPMYAGTTDPETARRWAAALAFPIHQQIAETAMKLLDPSKKGLLHA